MVSFPPIGTSGSRYVQGGSDEATSTPTEVVSGASNSSKGDWVEMIASTPFDAYGVWLYIGEGNATYNQDARIDVGVGADGSEVAIVPDLSLMGTSDDIGRQVFLPIFVPRGSRLSVRTEFLFADDWLKLSLGIVGYPLLGFGVFSHAVTYGLQSSTRGTQVEYGGTANAKGSYHTIASSLTHPVKHLLVCVPGDAATIDLRYLLDIAVGASGSERVIASNIPLVRTFSRSPIPSFIHVPVYINKGERVSARFQADDDEDLRITITGFH